MAICQSSSTVPDCMDGACAARAWHFRLAIRWGWRRRTCSTAQSEQPSSNLMAGIAILCLVGVSLNGGGAPAPHSPSVLAPFDIVHPSLVSGTA